MKLFCVSMICFLLFFSSPALGLVPDDQQIQYENNLVSFSSSMPLDGFLMQLARKAQIQLFVIENLPGETKQLNFLREPLETVLEKCLRNYNYAILYSDGSQEESGVFNYGKQKTFLSTQNQSTGFSQTLNSAQSPYSARENQTDFGAGNHTSFRTGGFNIGSSGIRSINAAAMSNPSSVLQDSTSQMVRPQNSTSVSGDGQTPGSSQDDADIDQAVQDQAAQDQADQPAGSSSAASISEEQKKIMQLEYKIKKLEDDINSGRAEKQYNFWVEKKDPKYVYNPWTDLARKKAELQTLLSN